jgi:two-component system sensor histidine kinase/response regulator
MTTTKVLLVDDYEDNLTVLELLLRSDGLELLKARSGREALEILLEHEIAVALIDVQMPEMDGFELAQLMRGIEKTRQIPILFITASAQSQQRLFNGYAVGAVDFMFKPIEHHVLKSKVGVFVQLHRQRQQIEEQLQQQREMLRLNEMLCAAIAHDLRNPLQTIAGGAMLLMKQAANEEQVRAAARRVHAGCSRMTKLIADLLDFSNARLTGSLPMYPESVDLHESVKKVIAEHQMADASAEIDLRVKGDMKGTWDEGRICQLASNLVGNALTHGDRSAPVSITLDGSKPDQIVLSFQNPGRIPPSLLPNIFDPFKSALEKRTGSSGLGLGLYIVQQIVQTHGGSIRIEAKGADAVLVTVNIPRHAGSPSLLQRSAGS